MDAAFEQASFKNSKLHEMGRLGRPHGVHGEVHMWPHNGSSELLVAGRTIQVGPDSAHLMPLTIEGCRSDAKGPIVRFAEIADREQAAALNGQCWFERREDFAPLEAGEFYVADLMGCRVHTKARGEVGKIVDLCTAGGMDYLVIETAGGERLVPHRPEFLIDIDLAAQVVTIADIGGLLDDEFF